MIKSVQKDYDETPTIKYPCILISKLNGAIVSFSEPGKGYAMNSGFVAAIGSISTGWEMAAFKPYNGTIELSNEEA